MPEEEMMDVCDDCLTELPADDMIECAECGCTVCQDCVNVNDLCSDCEDKETCEACGNEMFDSGQECPQCFAWTGDCCFDQTEGLCKFCVEENQKE